MFDKNYYCLVAGLREYSLDADTKGFNARAIIEEILEGVYYETDKDAVYMPRQREFGHYHDYIQEALRQIGSATGHQQRLAREGMVMKNGVAPSEEAVRQERLVVELASGSKMLELGLPARLAEAFFSCRLR